MDSEAVVFSVVAVGSDAPATGAEKRASAAAAAAREVRMFNL